MHVRFWGTRGSIAKAGPTTLRYGGNTSCVEVRADDGTLIVIDCGTGAHGLGQELVEQSAGAPMEGHILISHTHWDHIQGLPFFAPLFQPGNQWHIYGPRGLGSSLSETLAGQMQYNYFPVSIEQLAASVDYHDLVEGTFRIGGVRVTTMYLNHPALTLGYRLECDGATVVYASDHEPHDRSVAAGHDLEWNRHDRDHVRFAAGADLLIHDAQYLAAEYPDRVGWGHSTVEYVVDVANRAGVGTVALYHHDPNRTDEHLDEVVELARARATAHGYAGDVIAASEGMRIDLRHGVEHAHDVSARAMATDHPALEPRSSSVLIAVRSPELAGLLRSAAEAEQLDVIVANDRDDALRVVHTEEPAVVLLEAAGDGDTFDLAEAIRAMDPPYGGDVAIVGVGGTGAPGGSDATTAITEWLVWPSSDFYIRTKLRAWLLRRACKWQNAPLAPDEDRRLESLRSLDILDTATEARFDRYTSEISAALDVPVALISLVDTDRQWFKSRHGIDAEETPRDMSLCAHAILGDEILHVPDALADPRFAENPMVVNEPRVRFYAGVPLQLDDGARVGTLCVVDYRPRNLDDAQLEELRRVGDLVVRELQSGSTDR
jgi:phosphoribosyl 1,2-cyclic phosphodiesterase/CheY-like chemotaxis protein